MFLEHPVPYNQGAVEQHELQGLVVLGEGGGVAVTAWVNLSCSGTFHTRRPPPLALLPWGLDHAISAHVSEDQGRGMPSDQYPLLPKGY